MLYYKTSRSYLTDSCVHNLKLVVIQWQPYFTNDIIRPPNLSNTINAQFDTNYYRRAIPDC